MIRFLQLGLFVMCLELCTGTAGAQARLASGGGRIEVVRQNASSPAVPNQSLMEDDRVRTGNGSFATLELAPGARVVLGEQTEVELRSSQTDIRVSLERGTIKVFSNSRMAVITKDGEFSNAGGILEMDLNYRDSKLTIAIADGSVNTTGLTSNIVFAATNASSASRTYVAGGRQGGPLASGSCGAQSNCNFYPYSVYVNPNAFMPIVPGYAPFRGF